MTSKISPHPEWALKWKRPGTELRRINGRYCLYECSCKYDKETKKHRKKTGKYLGAITQEEGFIPSKKRILEAEVEKLKKGETIPVPASVLGAAVEYGLSWLIENKMTEITTRLKESFPEDYSRIIGLVYCRLRYNSPMHDVKEDFSDSHLSKKVGIAGLAPSQLSGFLFDLGGRREELVKYMSLFCVGSSNLIFDGTDLLSASRLMGLPQLTKTKTGAFDKAVNAMFVFSQDFQLPAYYRLLPGSIKDVKAFKLSMKESGAQNAVVIIDKTFPSKENLIFMEEEDIKYIASLRRSTTGLDYSCFQSRTNKDADGHFRYEGRIIWYKGTAIDGRRVVMFFDEEHRIEEDRDYMNRVENKKQPKYTEESYHAKALQFGTIALITNTDKDPQKLYESYKTRGDVEQAIDVFKTNLEGDATYMQNERSLEAFTFINFIALQIYYVIRETLRKADLLSKHSTMQLVKKLCRVRAMWVQDKWQRLEMTKKDGELYASLGWHIT